MKTKMARCIGLRIQCSAPGSNGAPDGVVHNQENSRSYRGNQNTVKVHSRHTRVTEPLEQPTADHRAHDTKQHIQHNALTAAIDDMAGNEAGNDAEQNPDE